MPIAHLTLAVSAFRLEIPWSDFDHLPQWLGCSLARQVTGPGQGASHLVLATEQQRCALHFDRDGNFAVLTRVEIEGDVQGRFAQQVLGTLLARYEGDLDGAVEWTPERTSPRLVVDCGQSAHPLLEPVMRGSAPTTVEVDQALAEAREAWAEYQRHKASHAADQLVEGEKRPKA